MASRDRRVQRRLARSSRAAARASADTGDHGGEIATAFELSDPTAGEHRDPAPLQRALAAVQAEAHARADLVRAVADMRPAGYPWSTIGFAVGTSADTARRRYGRPRPR